MLLPRLNTTASLAWGGRCVFALACGRYKLWGLVTGPVSGVSVHKGKRHETDICVGVP